MSFDSAAGRTLPAAPATDRWGSLYFAGAVFRALNQGGATQGSYLGTITFHYLGGVTTQLDFDFGMALPN